MRAVLSGIELASSDVTQSVGGYVYFPRKDVRMALLAQSPKTDSDRACPHGVQFYDVSIAGNNVKRAAWSYEAPGDRMKPIDHWIGFWGDVMIA
jgi:uncharacterized protein (DUF427 family)